MRRALRGMLIAACATAAWIPVPARGQIGFEDLLGHVTDIDVSATCWNLRSASLRRSDCPGGKNGYGVEVLWAVATVPLGSHPAPDTAWVPREKTVTVRQGRADTVTTLEPREEEPELTGWRILIELGIGYSQFSGFAASDGRLDLRGNVREQPSIAFYGSLEGPGVLERLSPYLGIRSGLIRLSDLQAFTPPEGEATDVFHGSGEVFQVGAAFGIAGTLGPLNPFVEAQLNLRRFTSVDWTNGEGGTIPGFLPRSLDFTGPSLSIGVQIHIRDEPG
ncbi:MAG TPA: hypothetical protein VF771_00760 [Longimicrobiaceae bacterium]